jgi:hypothetical protein
MEIKAEGDPGMNLPGFQADLRHFAAERDWQPFHTPKNLSTALMVEAAELAEIFQRMTPEQSRLAHQDAGSKPWVCATGRWGLTVHATSLSTVLNPAWSWLVGCCTTPWS